MAADDDTSSADKKTEGLGQRQKQRGLLVSDIENHLASRPADA